MLEEIVVAVNQARISYLLKQLELLSEEWIRRDVETWDETPRPLTEQRTIEIIPEDVESATVIRPINEEPEYLQLGSFNEAQENIITYVSEHEQERITYVVTKDYDSLVEYKLPARNLFYVHVPPWAKIRSATSLEMGEHVLGTANLVTGEIHLLESLDPGETTEVLLHETMHLLYPAHDERQIRDLVRTIMGKKYCRFH